MDGCEGYKEWLYSLLFDHCISTMIINPCTPNLHTHSVSLVVYFDDSSKASVKVNPSDTTADLLDKVKDRVTSSAALLWLVDNEGHGMSCDCHVIGLEP